MKDLTPEEKAILGALLWRFRFTLARMVGQHEVVDQMLAETAPAIPSELRDAVDCTVGGMDEDVAEVDESMRSEFAGNARIIDSILRKLCDDELNRDPLN